MVICRTLRIGRISTTGFTLSANKYSDSSPFSTSLHISYPARPNVTISLVRVGVSTDSCIQDVLLDSNGISDPTFNVTQQQTIYAMVKEGTCCSTFSYPPCYVSNYIELIVSSTGNINITSIPSGAYIWIDGTQQMVDSTPVITPVIIQGISVGLHSVTLKKIGYNDHPTDVTINADQTTDLDVVLNPMEGCIFFDSNPQGAQIWMNTTQATVVDTGFVTPQLICNLGLGTHAYKLVLSGYQYSTGTVVLGTGQGASISKTMTPVCIPNWVCEQPLNGYETDGCGNRRQNTECNPCIPNWLCEQPLSGYEIDGCGDRRANSACNPAPSVERLISFGNIEKAAVVLGAFMIGAVMVSNEPILKFLQRK